MFDDYNVDASFIIVFWHLKIILIALYHDKTITKLRQFHLFVICLNTTMNNEYLESYKGKL